MIEIRWKQRFESLTKAYNLFIETCDTQIENKHIYNMALVQSFEMVFELSWKTLKDYMDYQGISSSLTPRDVIKDAFVANLLENGNAFIEMLLSRNLMSHTYDDIKANEIVKKIKNEYKPEIVKLYNVFMEKL